ncbi:hypothetical protein BCR42DRAFT_428984 [Absidia repens]|uniref:Uncharacterized protein n=1 Tax=Absidia repens TaxID=90262 RepID=A0A1X2HXY6_9FUNG|nr:hypothetical protein BCR42DRAFT_428984 [Absidia repens]
MKASLWSAAQYIMGMEVKQQCGVWASLTYRRPTAQTILEAYGKILLIVWRMHWQCIYKNYPWHNNHALAILYKILWQAGMLEQQSDRE